MTSEKVVRRGVWILLLMVCAVRTAFPQIQTSQAQASQAQPSQSVDLFKAEETKLYGDAHPYLDEPLPKLKKAVHELGGLKPDFNQQPLPDILAKVGGKADELLRKVPDLISDEEVSETQSTVVQETTPGCSGADCERFHKGESAQRNQKFSYMILTHPAQNGLLLLEEYRTDRKDRPVAERAAAPHFQGFASAWLVFSSLNQVESRYRYLGQQQTDGHNTFVIAFAQIPGSIRSPGQFLSPKGSVPMLLQGIAWIDQSDFRVVRLRTDLLEPQPQVDFQKQTSNMVFGPVHIEGIDSELWLPRNVNVEMEANGQYLQEEHEYSKYRLYQAKTKIILSPN